MKRFAVLSLVVLLSSCFFGRSLMNVLAGEEQSPMPEKYYTSIQIQNGDSLWDIAGKYRENSGLTTAQYVEELKMINGLREDIIHSGHYLTVMYFTSDSD